MAALGVDTSRGQGQTQLAHYSVPLGQRAIVYGYQLSVEGTKTADFAFYQRRNLLNTTTYSPRRLIAYLDGVSGTTNVVPKADIITVPELTDIWWEVKAGSNNTV